MINNNKDLIAENETLTFLIWLLLIFLILITLRNIYNAYKKRYYRKDNNELKDHIINNQKAVSGYSRQIRDIEKLTNELLLKEQKITALKQQIHYKEKKIVTLGKAINNQKIAFEKFANYKTIEANNTRLGAHFIKNIINQIYNDLEIAQTKYKTIFGIHYKIGKSSSGIPPIKALKSIFKILDYNVSALNKTHISIKTELEHIRIFLELIQYLKPSAHIKFENFLDVDQETSLEIKPTLFFPFVENALKHGRLNDEDSFISIILKKTENEKIDYCLVNSADEVPMNQIKTDIDDGFGLNALEQLIDTYYPDSSLEHYLLPNNQYISKLTLSLS
ncbi:LytS family sensor histidine kinase [Kordia jejudonensis]|uniref:hypothetical protein n=1 Tax=Kordia jejudonensis TaxID=1348245 RepID=UPI000629389A|nr:hypothetical protein [Kordia jejudonensis]